MWAKIQLEFFDLVKFSGNSLAEIYLHSGNTKSNIHLGHSRIDISFVQ